ncbi:uncharacterized protein LOC109728945 [Ananas comosus]|uniref:Uncharacterized protein LOC109728945 n=1 Tax=Ananas comosus TaxID=4615 RepID=A0A6P5H6J3_ANACO|nr:uncharacterized protein LOC109728945 [Ananas comosus]
MGFLSALGRVLFAFFFLFSAWQEFNAFGVDGGPIAKVYGTKVDFLKDRATSYLGVEVPAVEIKHVVAAGIALKGVGGILFILGSSVGAYLLLLHLVIITPVLHDFANYSNPEFLRVFTQDLALFGTLLFFLGMKNSIHIRQSKRRSPKSKKN